MFQQFTIIYEDGNVEYVSNFSRCLTRINHHTIAPYEIYYVISSDLTNFYKVLGTRDEDCISNDIYKFRFNYTNLSFYMEDDDSKIYFIYAMINPMKINNHIFDPDQKWNDVITTNYVDGIIYYSMHVILGCIQNIRIGDFITQGDWNCLFYVSSIVYEENGVYTLFNSENDNDIWDNTRPFTIIRLQTIGG